VAPMTHGGGGFRVEVIDILSALHHGVLILLNAIRELADSIRRHPDHAVTVGGYAVKLS